ncbi:MAG: 4Fe-4S dicluster domain-containing protein [Bacillota bacterium]|nr:4Fe-4S dicluster domain-containing protein [Bacillota bacterium]
MKPLKINKDKCTGCRACEVACSAAHYNEFNYKRSRIRVPSTYPVSSPPVVCRQCKNAQCLQACPTGSLTQDSEGNIYFDESLCTKCNLCVEACPFDAMFNDVLTGLPIRCDLCGGNPVCVTQCQKKAITWSE